MRTLTGALLASLLLACGASSPTRTDGGAADAGADAGVADAGGAAGVDAGADAPLPAGYTAAPYLADHPETSFSEAAQVLDATQDYVAAIETDAGRMVIDLHETDAPVTVNSFVFLALHRFYEGIAFHRVIEGFVAQGGDPKTVSGARSTWGTGGPGYQFALEVKPSLNFDGPGVVGMARSSSPNSNGSQFFITLRATPNLDQQYTVFGRVITGTDALASIRRGEPPTQPTRISRVVIGTKPR